MSIPLIFDDLCKKQIEEQIVQILDALTLLFQTIVPCDLKVELLESLSRYAQSAGVARDFLFCKWVEALLLNDVCSSTQFLQWAYKANAHDSLVLRNVTIYCEQQLEDDDSEQEE